MEEIMRKCPHLLQSSFRVLMDLVLAWALEPQVSLLTRLTVFEKLRGFQSAWRLDKVFAQQVLLGVANDIGRTVKEGSS
jgi:hypothetical protein